MFHFLTEPFAVLWNHLNPITVRELRRCNRPRGLLAVLAVSYGLILVAYAAALAASPMFRQYATDMPFAVIGICAAWGFLGGLATVSASSKILTLCQDDPQLRLIGMSPVRQVLGYYLVFAVYAFCAMILPMPLLLITAAADFFQPRGHDCMPLCLAMTGVLFIGFFLTVAAAGYFFSFYAYAEGRMRHSIASLFAVFGLIFYFMSWAPLSDIPIDFNEYAHAIAGLILGVLMIAAMTVTSFLLSVVYFRWSFSAFVPSLLVNVTVYTLLYFVFFLVIAAVYATLGAF